MVIAMSHVLDVKPRVIAAEVKSPLHHSNERMKIQSKPHIAGELDLVGETTSEPHYVEVRDGALLLYPGRSPRGPALWRLPLRRLNLQPASSGRPRGFSLSRHGETVPLATFQDFCPGARVLQVSGIVLFTGAVWGALPDAYSEVDPLNPVGSDIDYERWVKTLAVELMRQTPLDAVRFLDILGITATLSSPHDSPMPLRRTHSADSVQVETTPRQSWSGMKCSSIQEEDAPNSMFPRSTQSLQRQRKSSKVPVSVRRNLVPLVLDSVKNSQNNSSSKKGDENHIKSRLVDCTDWCSVDNDAVFQENEHYKSDYVKNLENIPKSSNNSWENPPLPDVIRDLPPCERRSRARNKGERARRARGLSAEPLISALSDDTVAKLMARCQQDDRYVPVRDKRLLFETLCRRHFVCSTDNVSLSSIEPGSLTGQPRAQSLHDLSDCHAVAVKDMCKYFEQREPPANNGIPKRRTFSDRRQSNRVERRIPRNRQNVILSEEALWHLQEQAYRIKLGDLVK